MQNDTQKPLDSDVITYAFAVPLGFLDYLHMDYLYISFINHRGIIMYLEFCVPLVPYSTYKLLALYFFGHLSELLCKQMGLTSFPWLIFSRITAPFANSTIFAIVWMQFVLAINRLSAISYPIAYKHIFIECTRYVEADIYSWSTLLTMRSLFHRLYCFIALRWHYHCRCYCRCPVWTFDELRFSLFRSLGIIVALTCSHNLRIFDLIRDLVSISIISQFASNIIAEKRRQGANRTQQRLGHEILFFKETCVSTVIQVFSMIIFRIDMPVSRLTKVTYTWLMMHTLDGLSFIFFNRHLLKKQNIVGVRTNTVDLRTKTIRNDLNTAMICTTANTPVNIAVTKRSVNVIGNNIN
ncbi:hypothetical protein DINM_006131 [Dirofilaria immitis]|nr:hypothetical protein [Dirofilaria immitis]